MFYRPIQSCAAVAALMLTTGLVPAQLIDQTTYQGRLDFNGAAATGPWGVTFRVWDSAVAGTPVSAGLIRAITLTSDDDGVFTIDDLNFGLGTFDGSDRWLELVVWAETINVNGLVDPGELVETLTRQPITAAPQAQFALNSDFANFSGTSLNEAHANGNVIANNASAPVVIEGGLDVGTSTLNGSFDFNNSAAGAGSNIRMIPLSTHGASLWHLDENGSIISAIESDLGGEGIFVLFDGDGGSMIWDGDISSGGTNSGSRLAINGPVSTTLFDTSLAGDSSVALPTDSIGPSETLAEAGVANIHAGSVALTVTTSTILSRSITVPTDGYVLVLAQGDLSVNYGGTIGAAIWGVSASPTSLPSDQDIQFNLPAGLPNGFYDTSASAHGLFSVAAGTSTFYFNARTSSITGFPATIWDLNLTLLFVPTAYGTTQSNLIDPTNPDGGNNIDAVGFAPLTAVDIEAEYQAELARVRDEMQAKYLAQEARFAKIEAQLEASMREQEAGRGVNGGLDKDLVKK